VKEGGHDVPENIIADRYKMSLLYLRKEIFDFTEVHLIENSTETAEQIAVVKNGILISKKKDCPEWANSILYFIERVSNKK
jgi:predicted ABC-type ATPase